MNIAHLKSRILDLAVRGKLTEQRPEDGSAAELLARVREEKQRLIAEGKIKKEKPLPEITEDEKPFNIPASWEWCRLGEIGNIERGGSPRPIAAFITEDQNGINWIKIGDTKKGDKYIESAKEKIIPEGMKYSRFVHAGDFLLTNSMSFGRPYILKIDGCIHDGWLVFSDILSCISSEYLYYLLSSSFIYNAFTLSAAGSTVKNLNIDRVKEVFFPLPPLAEQKRIVEKIEQLFRQADTIEQNRLALKTRIRQTRSRVLDLAVRGKLTEQRPEDGSAAELLARVREEKQRLIATGKIKKEKPLPEITEDEKTFNIPASWEWCRLGSIMINRDSERIPLSVDERNKLEKKFDYYGASGIIDKVDKYLFDKTLLLIAEDGANLLARNSPIAFLAKGKYWVNNHAHVLDCIEDTLSMEYIMYFVNAITLAKYVTGTAQPKMNQEKMNSIPIPLPPLAEQKRIVEKIEQIFSVLNRIENAIEE